MKHDKAIFNLLYESDSGGELTEVIECFYYLLKREIKNNDAKIEKLESELEAVKKERDEAIEWLSFMQTVLCKQFW